MKTKDGPSPTPLLEEKSLWTIVWKSRCIKDSTFNWTVGLLTAAVFVVYAFLQTDTLIIYKQLMAIARMGVEGAFTVLGFLIAGFTVFTSVSKPALFLAMHAHRHSSGLSTLQYNFFAFMRVFAYYLFFTGFQIAILLCGDEGGVVYSIISLVPDLLDVLYWGNRIMLTLSATLMACVLLHLKSFVFDVYHMVMTSLAFELETQSRNTSPSRRRRLRR